MVLDEKKTKELAKFGEEETKRLLETSGFNVVKLDNDPRYKGKIKCPDYLISKGNVKFLCEVKTVNSARNFMGGSRHRLPQRL